MTDYKDEQDAFISEFVDFCSEKAFKEYVALLPSARQRALKKILHKRDPQIVEDLLEPYTSTEEFIDLFEEQAEKLFQNYLKTILHELKETQKNSLYKYFTALEAGQKPLSSQTA